MQNGKVLEDNLKQWKITEDELKSKLRLEGVNNYQQMRAATLEPSGKISLIREPEAEPSLMEL